MYGFVNSLSDKSKAKSSGDLPSGSQESDGAAVDFRVRIVLLWRTSLALIWVGFASIDWRSERMASLPISSQGMETVVISGVVKLLMRSLVIPTIES